MMSISFKKTLRKSLGKKESLRKKGKRRIQVGEVIYVDFTQDQTNEVWELHQPLTMSDESDYVMAIRCPDKNYHEIIARRIEKLNIERVPYKVFLDGDLVHHEKHL